MNNVSYIKPEHNMPIFRVKYIKQSEDYYGKMYIFEIQHKLVGKWGNSHTNNPNISLFHYGLNGCSFDPKTSNYGDLFWAYKTRTLIDLVFNEKFEILLDYYKEKNTFLKNVYNDYIIQQTINTRTSRKRVLNYCIARREKLKYYNIKKVFTFDELLDYARNHYEPDGRFERIYEDFRILYNEKLSPFIRTYARVIMNSEKIKRTKDIEPEKLQLLNFFQKYCGLKKQIGGYMLNFCSIDY